MKVETRFVFNSNDLYKFAGLIGETSTLSIFNNCHSRRIIDKYFCTRKEKEEMQRVCRFFQRFLIKHNSSDEWKVSSDEFTLWMRVKSMCEEILSLNGR